MDVKNLKDSTVSTLTDRSQLTERKVKQVNEVVSKIKQREGFFGIDLSKLTSWPPIITGLSEAFVVFIVFQYHSLLLHTTCPLL